MRPNNDSKPSIYRRRVGKLIGWGSAALLTLGMGYHLFSKNSAVEEATSGLKEERTELTSKLEGVESQVSNLKGKVSVLGDSVGVLNQAFDGARKVANKAKNEANKYRGQVKTLADDVAAKGRQNYDLLRAHPFRDYGYVFTEGEGDTKGYDIIHYDSKDTDNTAELEQRLSDYKQIGGKYSYDLLDKIERVRGEKEIEEEGIEIHEKESKIWDVIIEYKDQTTSNFVYKHPSLINPIEGKK
jgi:uncharacterized protein YutD/outer membrane murein-binding lipoprotein Lpp